MEKSRHLFKGLESRLPAQPGQVGQDGLLHLLQRGQSAVRLRAHVSSPLLMLDQDQFKNNQFPNGLWALALI